jgi:nucleoside-diphosphate-sugar epimerase
MHVNDLIDWFMTISTKINQNLIIANIGSDESVEIRDLAKMVAILNNKKVKQNEISSNVIDSYLPDTSYIKDKFNLKLKISLNDSLNILYQDFKKNDFVYKLYK